MIINNANVVTLWREKPLVADALLAIEEKTVLDFGRVGKLADKYHDPEVIEAQGRVVIPGTINLHSHLYRNFVRGMPLESARPRSLKEWNELIWWRLDQNLTTQDIHLAAMVGLMDSVRGGVTAVVDHHSSPRAISGSLEAIWAAYQQVGLRGAVSYAVSDRLGDVAARAGIEENLRFLREIQPRTPETVRGMMGLDASTEASDETIRQVVAAAKSAAVPIHMPVAEDSSEADVSYERYRLRPLARLKELGVLGHGGLLAHGSLLEPEDVDYLRKTAARLVHCPESDMSSGLRTADVSRMTSAGISVGMGGDGMGPSILQEFHAGVQRQRMKGREFKEALQLGFRLAFMENPRWATQFFDQPLGVIKPGSRADLVVMDYWPSSPLREGNLPEHFFWGLSRASVYSVIVNGRLIFHQGSFVHLDEPAIRAKAREACRQLWKRIREVKK